MRNRQKTPRNDAHLTEMAPPKEKDSGECAPRNLRDAQLAGAFEAVFEVGESQVETDEGVRASAIQMIGKYGAAVEEKAGPFCWRRFKDKSALGRWSDGQQLGQIAERWQVAIPQGPSGAKGTGFAGAPDAMYALA